MDKQEIIDKWDLLVEQPTEEKPFVIESYPYGRLRCKAKMYVETTKKGDRVCFQTKNPKTDVWNKVKKSTYSEVILLGIEKSTGYIQRAIDLSLWHDKEHHDMLVGLIRELGIKLNKSQEDKIKYLNAIYETRKHIKVEIRQKDYSLSEEEEKKQEEEQAEVKKKINNLFQYNLAKEHGVVQ